MSKKIGVGFIGTGFAKSVQMPAFAWCDNARLVSVSSGSAENAKAAAERFDIPHIGGDWRETVSHPEVDLVCITTPPSMHREMALFAIESGKHMLAEKPMAMNAEEAREMLSATEATNRLSLIDHELRFQPGRQAAFTMLREGEIGKIRHAKYLFQAPHRGDPGIPWNWWSDIEAGGGALGAIGSHVIDSFQWLLGTTVASVLCQLQTHVKKRRDAAGDLKDVTTDDQANMLLRFAGSELTDDATGSVSVSMTEGPQYMNRLEIFGEKGQIRLTHRGELFIAALGEKEWRQIEVELAPNIDGVPDTGFARGFMAFAPRIIEAIANGRSEVEYAATFEDGLNIQKVLDAARRSSDSGQMVEIASRRHA